MNTYNIPPLYRTKVVLTNWYQDALEAFMSTAKVTTMFKIPPEKIYERNIGKPHYMYEPTEAVAKLVPEPNNEVDPNAIMVYLNGQQIGYISQEDHAVVWPMYEAGCGCVVRISGGPYRIVDQNRNTMNGKSNYRADITLVLPV